MTIGQLSWFSSFLDFGPENPWSRCQ